MKAIVNEKFGTYEVLKLREVNKPVPKDNEVLIRTYATSVNTIDYFYRSGVKAIFGLARLGSGIRSPRKKILGFDVAGEIVAIGDKVTDFNIGDQVYGGQLTGANAEFTLSDDTKIAKKPSNMNYYEAGVIPMAGLSALQGLRNGNIQEGQMVLIYGASGGIGTYAVQLAKYFGGTVTAVASAKNEQLVRSLGADAFIDYQKEDFTSKSERYDLIFDTVDKSPQSRWKRALKDDGVFINAGSPSMSIIRFITSQLGNKFRKKRYSSFDTKYLKEDLEFLAVLAVQSKLRSVIDKTYSFEEISRAHKYYDKGHTAGKVADKVREDN
ncbi:MAG: NAD(P)-dependent alcohol dehydrogenase [Candidatus Heimdallarchaeota archaeon]